MANWYQRKPSDDAKLIMLLQLGQVDVVIAALQLSQARCEADGDVVPASVEPLLAKLTSMGLAPSTDETLHFLRMKRKHRGTTRYPVASGGTTENHVAPDKNRTEQIREEKKDADATASDARKARKPRQPSKGKLALAEFNAAVTEATGSPSCVTGMANETRAAAFADAIAAAGETMAAAVKRRHGLGKSLTLHWMMNDYASDRTSKRLAPVNTGNSLRQPHPSTIPTDPDEARKYWLGEQQDEPRFDFG